MDRIINHGPRETAHNREHHNKFPQINDPAQNFIHFQSKSFNNVLLGTAHKPRFGNSLHYREVEKGAGDVSIRDAGSAQGCNIFQINIIILKGWYQAVLLIILLKCQ